MKSMMLFASLAMVFSMGACAHKHKHGHKKSEKKMAKMWDKLDADKDGVITRAEFDKKHGNMFDSMDSNKDGKITKEEAKAHHKDKMGKKKDCCS